MKHVLFIFGGLLAVNQSATAGINRLLNLIKASQLAGAKVSVLALTENDKLTSFDEKGVSYILLPIHPYRNKKPLKKLTAFFQLGVDLTLQAEKMWNTYPFDVVCCYGGHLRVAYPLLKLRQKTHIAIVMNEWWNSSGGGISRKIDIELGRKYIYPQFESIISASTSLVNKFPMIKNKILIPAVYDEEEFLVDGLPIDCENINIAYAGNIGLRKDYTDMVVVALALLPPDIKNKFRLHLIGVKKQELLQYINNPEDVNQEQIIYYDYMSKRRLYKFLKTMDFTILIRPNSNYHNDGFANKFGESMMLGVPVIATLTSDMANYFQDGEQGFVVEEASPDAVAKTFLRIADNVDKEHIRVMGENAKTMAKKSFTLECAASQIKFFLDSIKVAN